MAKKAELEAADRACAAAARRAAELVAAREHAAALATAVATLPHLGGSLAYQRRFHKPEVVTLPLADLVTRLAPPLFARRPLAQLAGWVDGLKKADRALLGDLPGRVVAAGDRLATAVRVWADLGRVPPTGPATPDFLAVWQAAGLVAAVPAAGGVGYRRVTDLARPAVGKCPGCGRRHEQPLTRLLDPVACPGCGQVGAFVIVRRAG